MTARRLGAVGFDAIGDFALAGRWGRNDDGTVAGGAIDGVARGVGRGADARLAVRTGKLEVIHSLAVRKRVRGYVGLTAFGQGWNPDMKVRALRSGVRGKLFYVVPRQNPLQEATHLPE